MSIARLSAELSTKMLPTDAQQTCLLELAKYYGKSLEFRASQTDFEFQVSPLYVRFLGRVFYLSLPSFLAGAYEGYA